MLLTYKQIYSDFKGGTNVTACFTDLTDYQDIDSAMIFKKSIFCEQQNVIHSIFICANTPWITMIVTIW